MDPDQNRSIKSLDPEDQMAPLDGNAAIVPGGA